MKVRVDAGAVLRVHRCPNRLRDGMVLATSRPHPDAGRAERAGIVYRGDHEYCPCQVDGDDLLVPRGLLSTLQRKARAIGIDLDFVSEVVGDIPDRLDLDAFGVAPRPYQVDAIVALRDRVQGVVVLPCGGGKTTVGALAALSIGQAALVIVHTRDLLTQWTATFARALEGRPGRRVRVLGSGRDANTSPLARGEVCVAMVQAALDAPAVMASAAVVLVDEAHHAPASQWSAVLQQSPARWRWGLTATPTRSDGWGFLMEERIGPIVYEREVKELVCDGFLRLPLVVPVRVAWRPSSDAYSVDVRCSACGKVSKLTPAALAAGATLCSKRCGTPLTSAMEHRRGKMIWSTALSEWARSPQCAMAVEQLGLAGRAAGRRQLILIPRKQDARDVAALLKDHGVRADYITGDDRDRDHKVEKLRVGSLSVLVGTQIADEGLDVAAADMLVMASGGKSSGVTTQRGGRICRPAGHDVPVIFDLVPDGLHHQWHERRNAYIAAYGVESLYSRDPLSLQDALSALPE